jgi:hypothetical protein
MKKDVVILTLIGVVLSFSAVVRADLVSISAYSDSASAVDSAALLQDEPPPLGDDSPYPTFAITTTNYGDITWTGYILTLDPEGDATFVEDSGASTDFGTVLYPDAWTIEFWAPKEVPPGEVVTFEFKVDVPDPGTYSLAVTQNPIPEPATAALFGLGTLALLMRRRRQGA